MTLPMSLTRGKLLTGLCALAILITNAYGGLKAQRVVVEAVDGVDEDGNPDSLLGFDGPGKSYKNLKRGIIVQVTRSQVFNRYLKPREFRNRGLPILDPQTNETLTTTTDLLVVAKRQLIAVNGSTPDFSVVRGPILWYATQIKVYDPRFPVLPTTVPTTP